MTDKQFPSWEEFIAARHANDPETIELTSPEPKTKQQENSTAEYSETQHTNSSSYLEQARQQRIKKVCLLILIIAVAGAFAGLFIKFAADRAYLDDQLAAITENNEAAFADINDRLASIETEMNAISTSLDKTGASIDSSGTQTREAMEAQITALNKELTKLKNSLNILMESKGANQ